uniref:Putative amino acid tansporter n=1 Tax=Trypanosoma congolense (strain IL3000) TaxID=1068625 RepID=G0UWF4_TRYCI|nr:putative amino acid tansporter [Trypanosoma congolense IL3000]
MSKHPAQSPPREGETALGASLHANPRRGSLMSGSIPRNEREVPSQEMSAVHIANARAPSRSPKSSTSLPEVLGSHTEGASERQKTPLELCKAQGAQGSSRGSDMTSYSEGSHFSYYSVGDRNEMDRHSLGPQLTDILESSLRNGSPFPPAGQSYTSLGRAAFHIFKGNVGTGVFLLPTYYRDAGYVLGLLVVLILGVIVIDCVLALVRTKRRINHPGVHTYPAVVECVLGRSWMHFTKLSLLFTQFGFCVVYIQYASSLFGELFKGYSLYKLFVGICTVVVTLFTFVSHRMSFLAYMSMAATVCVLIVLTGATAEEVTSLALTGVSPSVWAIVPTVRIFLFISGHIFSLEGIGVVLPVENTVAPGDALSFEKVVTYVNASIVALYMAFGLLGYLAYGDALESSVVLAMPSSTAKVLIQALLGLSLIFGYPIQFVPAIQLVDRTLHIDPSVDKLVFYLVRVLFNLFVCLIAASIGEDTVNLFAGFLGAFSGIHLMVTLPALLALFTERVESAHTQVECDGVGITQNLSFCDYLKIFFSPPKNHWDYRWYAYLLFSAVVWCMGIYFTFSLVLL